jgi:monoamine oxidase
MGRNRLNLVKGSAMGRTIKGFVRYEKPWWRGRYPGHPGYTGYSISLKGPVCWTMDYCWWDASDDQWRHPALMFFIVGKDFDVWSKVSAEERRAAVLKQLGDIFSSSEAASAIGYHETNWTENEWSSGCPTACLKVNTLTSFGQALRAPIGRVHWAGAEVATVSVGYMDGALQSGLRAATEILALLDAPT